METAVIVVYAGGVEVLPYNVRMMSTDKRASEARGAMWLYSLDEVVKPEAFLDKLLQHYHLYAPCFEEAMDFHEKRPFIQQLVDILIPWEEAASDRHYADAKRRCGRRSEWLMQTIQSPLPR